MMTFSRYLASCSFLHAALIANEVIMAARRLRRNLYYKHRDLCSDLFFLF